MPPRQEVATQMPAEKTLGRRYLEEERHFAILHN